MTSTRRKLLQLAGTAGGALAMDAVPRAAGKEQAIDPAAFLAVFAKRQTVRRFKSDPVPDEHVTQILDAARRTPSCMNQQPWKFLVIRDPAKIERMKKRTLEGLIKYLDEDAARDNGKTSAEELRKKKEHYVHFTDGYFTAPVYVVVLVDEKCGCGGMGVNHDGPMAAGYLMLAARAFGYGTAYLTDGIPEKVVREVLAIPERYQRVCMTPIGVPDKWPDPKPKRKLEEMVAYETLEGHPELKPIPYDF